jgi:hypothetical protein
MGLRLGLFPVVINPLTPKNIRRHPPQSFDRGAGSGPTVAQTIGLALSRGL